jgi:hypothetical protein
MANKLSENQILEIAKKSINKIKATKNPYKNLAFVDNIFEGCDKQIKEDVKSLVKEQYRGKLKTNLFENKKLSAAHHLYNYLYENNLLSKYGSIAEYMDYPSANQLKKK